MTSFDENNKGQFLNDFVAPYFVKKLSQSKRGAPEVQFNDGKNALITFSYTIGGEPARLTVEAMNGLDPSWFVIRFFYENEQMGFLSTDQHGIRFARTGGKCENILNVFVNLYSLYVQKCIVTATDIAKREMFRRAYLDDIVSIRGTATASVSDTLAAANHLIKQRAIAVKVLKAFQI